MKTIFLGIETSCDETSMAIIVNGKLISHVTTSSVQQQAQYGGVVPEVASRYHLKNLHHVFLKTLHDANLEPKQITHIAYTALPGLPGSIHVGTLFAKMLSSLIGAKLIPINHLYGHLFSPYLEQENLKIEFPFLGLVVSGGHTTLYDVKSIEEIEILNETSDDAIGEVYDKVARVLGWSYPGGPIVDKNYDEAKADLKFVGHHSPKDQFSYSGLKTAVINHVHKLNQQQKSVDKIQIASSFQKEIIDDLIKKTAYIFQKENYKKIVIGGGVSANRYLRTHMQNITKNIDIPLLKYTGDNAAMIVFYAYQKHFLKNELN